MPDVTRTPKISLRGEDGTTCLWRGICKEDIGTKKGDTYKVHVCIMPALMRKLGKESAVLKGWVMMQWPGSAHP